MCAKMWSGLKPAYAQLSYLSIEKYYNHSGHLLDYFSLYFDLR